LHPEDAAIQPPTKLVFPGRLVAIDMVGETVAAGIVEAFPGKIGSLQQPIDGQFQYSSAAQQFPGDGRRSSSSVVKLSHVTLYNRI
jgi:hypothetical protein